MSPRLSDAIVCRKDGVKQLVSPARGTVYRALSAEAATAYGLSPVFLVHDELGVVRCPRSELFEVLETVTSAQLAPLSIIISTQAPTDADLLSILLDDALSGHNLHTVCLLHCSGGQAPIIRCPSSSASTERSCIACIYPQQVSASRVRGI